VEEISTALDILVILTNVPEIELKVKFDPSLLLKILSLLTDTPNEGLRDKIDVISMIYCK
jgi:hypothetical protein